MKSLTLGVILAAALTVPTTAQQMGSTNRDAPTVEQSIEFTDGNSVEIDYKALTWAEGKFVERLKSNEQFRENVNKNAKENPVGSLQLKSDMSVGGKTLKAGEYGLHFFATAEGGWQLALSMKDGDEVKITTWDLDLKEKDTHKQRLTLALSPVDDANSCELYLHFGKMATTVAMKPAGKTDGEKQQ